LKFWKLICHFKSAQKETTQWAKSPKKSSLKQRVFVNSALKLQCHNTLLQTAFSAILPTGNGEYTRDDVIYVWFLGV